MTIFASAFDESADVFQVWCGSSAWLECRPVTPEVEGSSPFRTAKKDEAICFVLFLLIFVETIKQSNVMTRRLIQSCAILLAMTLSCGRNVPPVEEGVSLSLAQYRSSLLSDIRYDIEFRIPENVEERVGGRETIVFSLKGRSDVQLDFREGANAVVSLNVNGKDCRIDYRNEHIVIDGRLLHKGENSIDIEFVSGDRSMNRNEEYLYTLFVPDRARTVFPCFDQPDLKGRFSLTLDLPKAWEAVSNGPEESSETSEGRKRISFKETPPLSTYLFAFTAGIWQKETRYRADRPMTVLYRETDPGKIAQIDEIFAQVSKSLDWLEEYTGIPCPFEKYDFVIVPGFQFGGMEHPGAILYNDRRIFLDDSPTTTERLSRIELIAHETSHLWFGDAVTMRWFNDVWTKEVFANYFAARISTPLFPEVNVPLRDFRNFNINAYSEDRTAGTNSIRQDLPNLSSAGLIYGNIVYDKAPVVMRMLSDLLGDEAFREGIREYLRTFLYSNADWSDLIAILDARTSLDLEQWSKVWVEEKGMPTISYEVNGDSLTVRQEDPLERGLVWPERITFGNEAGEAVVSLWSDAPEVSVQLPEGCNGILFPDPDALSYGWFLLDEKQASTAMEALPSIQRPEARLSLLASLYENFINGKLDPEAFAGVLGKMLRKENDPLVAGAVVSYLKTLSIHGPLAGSKVLEDLLADAASDASLPKEVRLTVFRTLSEVFRSEGNLSEIWDAFKGRKGYKGIELSVRDYMSLAYELSVRCPDRYDEIISLQEGRIDNPDLLREFRHVARAVSPSKESRDSLFTSLLEPENRTVEPWTASALSYLNHPLRQTDALPYIYPGLEEMPEIQRTGDIFFPKNWCVSLLRGHDSKEAAEEVRQFLDTHPDFPGLLKGKLLQSADHLLREN